MAKRIWMLVLLYIKKTGKCVGIWEDTIIKSIMPIKHRMGTREAHCYNDLFYLLYRTRCIKYPILIVESASISYDDMMVSS